MMNHMYIHIKSYIIYKYNIYNYVSIYQLSTGQVIRQREEERTQKILFRGEAGSGQAGPGPGNPQESNVRPDAKNPLGNPNPFRTNIPSGYLT